MLHVPLKLCHSAVILNIHKKLYSCHYDNVAFLLLVMISVFMLGIVLVMVMLLMATMLVVFVMVMVLVIVLMVEARQGGS